VYIFLTREKLLAWEKLMWLVAKWLVAKHEITMASAPAIHSFTPAATASASLQPYIPLVWRLGNLTLHNTIPSETWTCSCGMMGP